MADHPHVAAHRPRPLSPFLIYHWSPTMASSITHRVTGIGLGAGAAALTWWLMAASRGPEAYEQFNDVLTSIPGQVLMFGFAWALSFHLLNGIRHLAWDMGYGFAPKGANRLSVTIFVLSLAVPAALFALSYAGLGGYYQ